MALRRRCGLTVGSIFGGRCQSFESNYVQMHNNVEVQSVVHQMQNFNGGLRKRKDTERKRKVSAFDDKRKHSQNTP